MSRKRIALVTAFVALLVLIGGRLAEWLEHWFLALHGHH